MKTKTTVIERFIAKEEEKSYLKLPFEVPEKAESMEFLYSYEGDGANSRVTHKQKNVIDFALIDETGSDAGTRGSSVRQIYVSASSATPGFKKREIQSGTWHILLGAYQIKDGGVKVRIDITFTFKEFQWLKGDTHIHTDNSDGKKTHLQIAKMAKKKKLDYIIFTDHNNDTRGLSMPSVKGITVIRGLELTSYLGHINFFGCEKPYDGTFAVMDEETIREYISVAKSRGAIVSVNHPICSICPWKFSLQNFDFDAVEVWNGPMRKDNLNNIAYWNGLLKSGKRVTALGGSDYHRDYYITDLFPEPATYVYSEGRGAKDILGAIKAGRVMITSKPGGTFIDINVNGAGIGGSVPFTEGMTAAVTVKRMKRGHTLNVIDGGGTYFTYKAKRCGDYNFDAPVRGKGFIRVEVMYEKRGLNKLIHKIILYFMLRKEASEPVPPFQWAMTNPVYIE